MSDDNTQNAAEPSPASAGSVANDQAEVLAKGIADIIRIAAEPDWIPVTERLPDEYEVVMVGWAGRRDIGKGYLLNGKWHDPLVCIPDVNQPTHWMPLPTPPSDGK